MVLFVFRWAGVGAKKKPCDLIAEASVAVRATCDVFAAVSYLFSILFSEKAFSAVWTSSEVSYKVHHAFVVAVFIVRLCAFEGCVFVVVHHFLFTSLFLSDLIIPFKTRFVNSF